ncbi:MAG: SAM-dependent chlorinase/fluorinase [Desulfobacterales bacterium]|nr:SAM-dependent chlorinase/fluorinase [Desulfobacterales bacterium]
MAVISLLTDFGTDDEYVGLVKAVIYGIAPGADIVDLCHRIEPQDVAGAAFLIASAWRYFPEHSVHLVVVDPGVGTDRAIIAAKSAGHTFVAPDNGVLTRILDNDPKARIVRVENRAFYRAEVSRTFHGRDIFAPVGAHLLRGVPLDRLGPAAPSGSLRRIEMAAQRIDEKGEIVGTVVWVDRFGNLITDIEVDEGYNIRGEENGQTLQVRIGGRTLTGLHRSYGDVEPGRALAVVGSRGTLEIAVNCGSASEKIGCSRGDPVRVRFDKAGR